jgi:hypothetical protein
LGGVMVDRRTKRCFGSNAYLECHGTHIILPCEGEKARGVVGVAVK